MADTQDEHAAVGVAPRSPHRALLHALSWAAPQRAAVIGARRPGHRARAVGRVPAWLALPCPRCARAADPDARAAGEERCGGLLCASTRPAAANGHGRRALAADAATGPRTARRCVSTCPQQPARRCPLSHAADRRCHRRGTAGGRGGVQHPAAPGAASPPRALHESACSACVLVFRAGCSRRCAVLQSACQTAAAGSLRPQGFTLGPPTAFHPAGGSASAAAPDVHPL